MGESYRLKWNNHQENLMGIMTKLLDEKKFVDVSLVCETKVFKAHQTVLSASSPYFEQVLEENQHPHPIIILKDVKEKEMSALLQYMYRGEVSVKDEELSAFLQLARELKIKGLTDHKKELTQESTSFPGSETTYNVPPKRAKTVVRTNEAEAIDVQSPTGTSSWRSFSYPSTQTVTTSENSSDMHYSSPSISSQTIKQESDMIQEPNSENHDNRSELLHRLEDWSVEQDHSPETRNLPKEKVELPKVPLPFNIFSSQLQGPSMPGLYPCNAKGRPKKDQPSTSHEPKPKPDYAPGPSFSPNHPASVVKNTEAPDAGTPGGGIPRKGGRFRPGWMESYTWLQYDECLNTMYCKTCRKWSSSVPDIRTSFVEGNGNFRLEIVNHHHKSKAHKLCMAKEEEAIPRLERSSASGN